ncbi:hypothetical protein R1sor_021961 [Riccia sorocarpa]|uniref:LOB domain-containing protein n=1 Tax=Riccia sorocarpa TaxID=122646 RepID=A0ABD3GIH0_9MARC
MLGKFSYSPILIVHFGKLQRETFGLLDSNSRKIRRTEPEKGARRGMLGSQGQGNSSTPCAACKLLRRRCAQECPFSPYFSPHEPQKFACVHKIFGASNVSKMLMEVPEAQRADAASSLVYEANARIRDPVYGCMGAISALQQQAQSLQAELDAVRQEIMRYRCHENAVAAVMVAGYQQHNNDRSTMSGQLSSQNSGSPDYCNSVASPSRVATPEAKERYWASIN